MISVLKSRANFKAIQCRSVAIQREDGCRGIRGLSFGIERSKQDVGLFQWRWVI
jgi:hypothetical protein